MLAVAALVVMSNHCLAVFYGLGPSKDDWGMKFDVEVTEADADNVTVVFTLEDDGRLKPIHSINLVAFSKPDAGGGRSYDLKAPIKFQVQDGKRVGQATIRKEFVNRANFRVLTQRVDGKHQSAGAAYYDIPLKRFTNSGQDSSPVANSPEGRRR
jgi:hypothetical protein